MEYIIINLNNLWENVFTSKGDYNYENKTTIGIDYKHCNAYRNAAFAFCIC